jgi:putative transposase
MMTAATAIKKTVDIKTGLPIVVEKTTWDDLIETKRVAALLKYRLLAPILVKIDQGLDATPAIQSLLVQIENKACEQNLIDIAHQLGRDGKPPSKASFHRWLVKYDENGLLGLAAKNEGQKARPKDWEARALYWQQKPSKMLPGAIAQVLCAEGFDVKDHQVRRWLKTLPDDVRNKKRMGNKFYRDTQMPSRRRDTSVLAVGEVYQGDGHTIDVYIAHPNTGNPWRFELTAWMDVRSRYIAGLYLTESESANSTLLALSKAMIDHDHIPDGLHIDNGSGYKSHMMTDEVTGFYSRFNILPMFALPGNSKGKGQIERWFRTLRDSFDKRWDSYCGHDMANEAIQKVLKGVRQKKSVLPSSRDYLHALQSWLDEYHNKPHRSLDGKTPAELWATLERNPLHMSHADVARPSTKRFVRRGSINLDNREYRHPELQAFNKQELIVEFDLFNDATITALTLDGRKICEPTITNKIDYLPPSRIEEHSKRRLEGQIKRLEKKAEEKRERSRNNIDHAALANHILDDGRTAAIEQGTTLINAPTPQIDDQGADDDLDIFDTDY